MKSSLFLILTLLILSKATDIQANEVPNPTNNDSGMPESQLLGSQAAQVQTQDNLSHIPEMAHIRNLAASDGTSGPKPASEDPDLDARENIRGLLVNNKAYDCSNAAEYLNSVKSDAQNLNFMLKKLGGYLDQLRDSVTVLEQLCDMEENELDDEPETVEPTQPAQSSTDQGSAMNKTVITKLPKTTVGKLVSEITSSRPAQGSNQVEKAIFDKIQAIMETLSKSDNDEKCKDSFKKIKELKKFITHLQAEITEDLLAVYLPKRAEDLEAFLQECIEQAPVTQSGVFTKVYWGTGHIFESGNDQERKESFEIVFDEPFQELPVVAVSLKGFDLDYREAGVRVTVGEVTNFGFTLYGIAPPKSRVYSFSIAWLATVTSKSSIQVHRISYDAQYHPELAKISYGFGPRNIDTTIKFKEPYQRPGVVSSITGFKFTGGGNMRLRTSPFIVEKDSAVISIVTWYDSDLLAVDATVISYEVSEEHGTGEISTDVTGVLYSGFGPRSQSRNLKVPIENPCVWPALTLIDFIYNYNYRLSHDYTFEDKKLKHTYTTWSNTQLYYVANTIFYTPAKPKKLVTQTGTYNATYLKKNHPFEKDSTNERSESVLIKFPYPFETIPSVAVALQGFDAENDGTGVFVQAEQITHESFYLTVTVPAGSRLYQVVAVWLATVSNTSRIFVSNIELDRFTDEQFKGLSKGSITRTASYLIDHPTQLRNPSVYVAISGFKYASKSDLNLEVKAGSANSKNFKLSVSTWNGTVIEKVSVAIIHYDHSATQGEHDFVSNNQGGATTSLNKAILPGSPTETPILQDAVLFAALTSMDYMGRSFNLKSLLKDVRLVDKMFSIQFPNWASSANWKCKYGVFYTQQRKIGKNK